MLVHSLAVSQRVGVLFLSSAERHGADTFIHALLMRGLDRSRFDVHVACPTGTPEARTNAYKAFSVIPDLHLRPTNFGPSLRGRSTMEKAMILVGAGSTVVGLAGLAWYIRRRGIRVLHSTDRPRDAIACWLLGKWTGAKSVVHVHVQSGEWRSPSVRRAMSRVDALVGVSEFVARSLVDNGYEIKKTHAVLNAIDPAAWDYHLDGSQVRRTLGIPATAPVVACAARLFRGKGQDDLIRALALIQREVPDVRLLIIGEDDRFAMRTSFTQELQALARDLGLVNKVFFTGYRADMPALLAACDVFALPSFEEPFGLVYLEAMAMKKPVVALNNGGTPEVVEDGKSGLLSAPGDLPTLAKNLLTLIRDPERRACMGEYGRCQVETRFTPERMARDTARVYARLAP
jgi:glycosyltransferase involved in cell wall biosynthesis